MSSIDGKISCDRCGEYNHERSMVFHGTTAMCIGCDDEVEELDSEERVFFPCDECGTMTADHMLASVHTEPRKKYTLMRKCCPMCYSECYEDSRGVLTEYTISYLEVIKHEVKVTAMSRAQAERITLSGDKEFALRTTRLPQTIGKSIVVES
jgi:hypothetical protein